MQIAPVNHDGPFHQAFDPLEVRLFVDVPLRGNYQGVGVVKQDYTLAAQWYEQAARQAVHRKEGGVMPLLPFFPSLPLA
jgi:hypothetical protein